MAEKKQQEEEQVPQDSLSKFLDEIPAEDNEAPEPRPKGIKVDDEEIPEDKVPDLIRKGRQFERRNAEFNRREQEMKAEQDRYRYYAQVDARLASASPEEREAVKRALDSVGTGRPVSAPASEPEPEFEDEEVKKLARLITGKMTAIERQQGEVYRKIQETDRQREARERLDREIGEIRAKYGASEEDVLDALQFGRQEGVSKLEHAFRLKFPDKANKQPEKKDNEEDNSVANEERSFSVGNARPRPGSGGAELTSEERDFCRRHNKDPKKYALAKQYVLRQWDGRAKV